jgi:toxin-antitoxin system PIN domain toxin
MIVPDVNLLVYAYNEDSPDHDAALNWWRELLGGTDSEGLPWVVSTGFVRVIINPRVVSPSLSAVTAVEHLMDWLGRDHVVPLEPHDDHLAVFRQNIAVSGGGTNLVTDAHIAALAMEYNAVVHSADSDFGRFSGVRWYNPLA